METRNIRTDEDVCVGKENGDKKKDSGTHYTYTYVFIVLDKLQFNTNKIC
jgi:hypothetical protein